MLMLIRPRVEEGSGVAAARTGSKPLKINYVSTRFSPRTINSPPHPALWKNHLSRTGSDRFWGGEGGDTIRGEIEGGGKRDVFNTRICPYFFDFISPTLIFVLRQHHIRYEFACTYLFIYFFFASRFHGY